MQFVINNWHLFVALIVVLALLFAGPVKQMIYGIASIPIARAVQLVNHESGVIVDVRESNEYKEGHIPRAINLPLSAFPAKLKELEKYKQKPVILCCASGSRSMRSAMMLRKHGFTSVHNLSGGLTAWKNENLPTET